jgi:DNA-binding transcriptional LysR family regulator
MGKVRNRKLRRECFLRAAAKETTIVEFKDKGALRGVTLQQLRAFSLVARHRSFARAANELHLTPSAVSIQIKGLEQAVGVHLIDRSARLAALTKAGELLLVDVQLALAALQHGGEALTRLRDCKADAVSVGMVSSAKYFLPRILARFQACHADVDLHLRVGNRQQLIEQLRQGTIDLAVMGEPPEGLDVHAEPFASLPMGVVAAPEHALARTRGVPGACLAGHRFIVRERGSGTRAAMQRYFDALQIAPPLAKEVSSNAEIKQAVMANLGLAFLALHAASLELRGGLLAVVDVAGLPLNRRWFVVGREACGHRTAPRALRSYIAEHGGQAVDQQFDGAGSAAPGTLPLH